MQSSLGWLQARDMSDYDAPSACWRTYPRARKSHKCDECRGEILVGEVYQKIAGVWSGEFDHWKTCAACESLREKLREANVDSYLGGLYEAIEESDMLPAMLILGAQAT